MTTPHTPRARRDIKTPASELLRQSDDSSRTSTFASTSSIPSLTNSTSDDSSHSQRPPSPPATPRAQPGLTGLGITGPRYPAHLTAGRGAPGGAPHVPLHRRGTSHTYERLEDLLKEAGYKDTRVFTPEADRVRAQAKSPGGNDNDERDDDNERCAHATHKGAVDTVVGFLSHLVSSRTATPAPSSPPSPLSHKRSLHPHNTLHTPSASGRSSPHPSMAKRSHTDPASTPTLRPRPSQASGLSYSEAAHAAQHLRTAALRHMASVPDLTPRTKRLATTQPAHALRRVASSRPPPSKVRSTGPAFSGSATADGAAGPVPTSWLESVARAVLGVPSSQHHLRHPSGNRNRRPSRSPNPRRSDGTRGRNPAPAPGPGNYLSRAPSAPGTVSAMNVVCRSAPGSRAPSTSASISRRNTLNRAGKRRPYAPSGTIIPRVPILARTATEGDVSWSQSASAQLSPTGSIESSLGAGSDEDDEDEEGDLDLARILVPPKRKHSIHSLRRHLVPGQAAGGGARIPRVASRGRGLDLTMSRADSVAVQNQADPFLDDREQDGLVSRGTMGSRTSVRRPEMPVAWGDSPR